MHGRERPFAHFIREQLCDVHALELFRRLSLHGAIRE